MSVQNEETYRGLTYEAIAYEHYYIGLNQLSAIFTTKNPQKPVVTLEQGEVEELSSGKGQDSKSALVREIFAAASDDTRTAIAQAQRNMVTARNMNDPEKRYHLGPRDRTVKFYTVLMTNK